MFCVAFLEKRSLHFGSELEFRSHVYGSDTVVRQSAALLRQYQIHNITHLLGSDSVIVYSYIRDVFLPLFVEWKNKIPSMKI